MGEALSGEDLDLMARAVCWVFVLVAAADGKVDRAERKRLAGLLGQADAFDTAWMKAALGRASEQLDAILARLEKEPKQAVVELEQAASLAEARLGDAEAREVKHDLLAFGKAIAQASGGVLGLGSKIDANEEQAIGRLATVLRYA